MELGRCGGGRRLAGVSWLPDDFFIGHLADPEPRPNRPLGQGDVFPGVPVAGKTALREDGVAGVKAKVETVIVVASSCGMRKAADGELNELIHVAPIKRLASLAPGWGPPWDGWLHVLPLPGLALPNGDQPVAANLGRIGLCSTTTLKLGDRMSCVSLPGMRALKARVATYFVREEVPDGIVGVGAHEEWHELDLWERWTERSGSPDGFQPWLSEINPNYPDQRRRDTLYDDLEGIREQLDAAT